MFGLEIVVEAETQVREMFADDGHSEIGPIASATGFRQDIAIVPRRIGELASFLEELLPFFVR